VLLCRCRRVVQPSAAEARGVAVTNAVILTGATRRHLKERVRAQNAD
jgi:hypothetical protein